MGNCMYPSCMMGGGFCERLNICEEEDEDTSHSEDVAKLKNELELMKEMIQESFRVIEFYAMRESWAFSYSTEKEITYREIIFDAYSFYDETLQKSVWYGGKRAREFMKRYGLLLENQYKIKQKIYEKTEVFPTIINIEFPEEGYTV
jgi:hypothetical protein